MPASPFALSVDSGAAGPDAAPAGTADRDAVATGPAGPDARGSSAPPSLATQVLRGARPAALVFPGIDPDWRQSLTAAIQGRPELAAWLEQVAAGLDEWAARTEILVTGHFPDGLSPVLLANDAGSTDSRALKAPFLLVGSLLANLAQSAGIADEGLPVAAADALVGHSVGLLAAWVAGGGDAQSSASQSPAFITTTVAAAKVAAVMGMHAADHRWSVPAEVALRARHDDPDAATPMASVSGLRRPELAGLVGMVGPDVVIAVTNGPRQHVVAGDPAQLRQLQHRLDALARKQAEDRAAGRHGGEIVSATWQWLPSTAAFHHPDLAGAAAAALAQLRTSGVSDRAALAGDGSVAVTFGSVTDPVDPMHNDGTHRIGLAPARGGDLSLSGLGGPLIDLAASPARRVDDPRVVDPATGLDVTGPDALEQIVTSILSRPHDFASALRSAVRPGGVAILVSGLSNLSGVAAAALRGAGVVVLDPSTREGRTALFTAGSAPEAPGDYERFRPSAVRRPDGSIALVNRHTAATGRSPIVLAGMTPSTVEVPIVAAAASAGHVAELAGGGQVSERIFDERMAELRASLEPEHEVVFNAMYLDPYLWDLHLGRSRLVQRARAAGAPLCGVTISAGVPPKEDALALLDELNAAGMWLNAFKPGTVAAVGEVLQIASETPHRVWMHLEGGAAGGHHSWEDLDELLLQTYHLIRNHDNVYLAVGGGIGDPARAAQLLTGDWAAAHGERPMPVDAVLLGTVAMATRESGASPQVKAALVAASGHDGWVFRGEVAGGTTSGRSGLNADIHFVENSAAAAARLLEQVAGDAAAVDAHREEIAAALARTAKPYFGDVDSMTYEQVLRRFADLTALGRQRRYDDGAWLDPTHRTRFVRLLQRVEARLCAADSGEVPTLFADPGSVDDPQRAIDAVLEAHPTARTALLHPADVAAFRTIVAMPGKPVPFVPFLDEDVRRWYLSDALWQAHDDRYAADEVLIIPGPRAVGAVSAVDEPVAALLDRFEGHLAGGLLGSNDEGSNSVSFRLAVQADRAAPGNAAILRAALAAPTWTWLGSPRSNPALRIGAVGQWHVDAQSARWAPGSSAGAHAETAELTVADVGGLLLTVRWPALDLPGDGELTIPVEVTVRAGVIAFAVTEQGLADTGSRLLRMFAHSAVQADDRAHSAALGAVAALPDRVMSRLWPTVFTRLAETGVASGLLDLVHVHHEIAALGFGQDLGTDHDVAPDHDVTPAHDVAPDQGVARDQGEDPPGPSGVLVGAPAVSRTEAGHLIRVVSRVQGLTVRDHFLVRRAAVDPELPPHRSDPDARDEMTPTPRRSLGSLSLVAPTSLTSFAALTGDANPIHRCDALARLVGLPSRIVHGMWTSAAASRAVVELAAEGSPERLRRWQIDFIDPVLPAEAIEFHVTRVGMRAGARIVEVEATCAGRLVARGVAEVAPPRTVLVFPGQGIQSLAMGMDSYAASRAARAVWDEADRITDEHLGFSILDVVQNNPTSLATRGTALRPSVVHRHPAGVLHLTQFTQVAMATLAAAQVAQMRAAGVFDETAIVAGHSVGEYNALAACSGVLSLRALIELVFARGQAMHGLVPRDDEGRSAYRLAVIRPHLAGLTHAEAEHLVQDVAHETGQLCQIVNHNLRGKQYAVAGTVTALEQLAGRLPAAERGREPLLEVPGIDVPFHSTALVPGVDGFRQELQARLPARIDPVALVGRYIPNLYPQLFSLDRGYVESVQEISGSQVLADVLADWDRRATDPGELARTLLVELLAWQFASPVRWIETVELLTSHEGPAVERFIEVGVGSAPTLTNLAKGALALPTHAGTRPTVLNVEMDADAVFERDADAPLDPSAQPDGGPVPAPGAQDDLSAQGIAERSADVGNRSVPPSSGSAVPPDLPVDHGLALHALLALRAGVRPEQLGATTIESLVEGASSRRNQVLMDMGKEFAVAAIDGAHEVPLPDLIASLAERSPGYRYPGPVLGAAIEAGLGRVLGPLGADPASISKRVSGHWGLGEGWVARAACEIALGAREGTSKRGGRLDEFDGQPSGPARGKDAGDSQTAGGEAAGGEAARKGSPGMEPLPLDSLPDLVDAAVRRAGIRAGTELTPVAVGQPASPVDAAAIEDLRGHVEDLLAASANEMLQRLGRTAPPDGGTQDFTRELGERLSGLESEHGAAKHVAATFDPRRHVHLDSAGEWALADVERLVQTSLGAEAAGAAPDGGDLLDQIVVHRDSEPRIGQALGYHRARLTHSAPLTAALLDQALHMVPAGVSLDTDSLQRGLAEPWSRASLRELAAPGQFAGEVALVTGASPGSIAFAALPHLLRGGATVIVVTTNDGPQRMRAYRALERRWAAPGASLHVIRANLASFADIDALLEWLTTPTVEQAGASTREVKPALWPTLVLPFAAAPSVGAMPEADHSAELTLRLMLLGVQRLVGGLAQRWGRRHGSGSGRGRGGSSAAPLPSRVPVPTVPNVPTSQRFTVVLPLSPNHGIFGGDGAYAESKAGLETMVARWHSESAAWGRWTRVIGAEIGWVRGTGLMAGNDRIALAVQRRLAITIWSSEEMGAMIASLCLPAVAQRASAGPLRVDLSGGLSQVSGVADALVEALTEAQDDSGSSEQSPEVATSAGTIPALPNLPDVLLHNGDVDLADTQTARIPADDMIVIAGIAELGPYGGSTTRWQAESGAIRADGIVELAWRMGLIEWDRRAGLWRDAETAESVPEPDLEDRYREKVQAHVGVRRLADTAGVDAGGFVQLAEAFLERPLTRSVSSRQEAEAIAGANPGTQIHRSESAWLATLPAGAGIRVPVTRPLARSVGGQFPLGLDPVRHGLDRGAAAAMDPLAAWNLVVTAEAFAAAGITPEELQDVVHPSLIANTQGTGMGGMTSIRTLHMVPVTGREHANDILQEALGNVMSAHVNQGFVGGYGPMVHPVAACATAAVSLEAAVDLIRLGKADVVVAGGWDDLGTEGIQGFADMAATADNDALIASGIEPSRHSRPGDRRRRGFVESQGGGTALVVRGSVARRLGLPVRAVVGYASSFGDGIQTSIPAPGLGALGAVRGGSGSPLGSALADLGLSTDDIHVVSKHDTSTAANDPNEAAIHARIQAELGRSAGNALRVISQKALTGHAKGGAAAWQLAGLCDVFDSGIVPGNANLESVDPHVTPAPLVVDNVPLRRHEPVRAALLTSLGFGHVSAVVLLAHPEVFVRALHGDVRQDYLRRSRQRRVDGARRILAAMHGGDPVLVRRSTRVLSGDAEADMLVGLSPISSHEGGL